MTDSAPLVILLAAGRGSRFDPAGVRKKLLQLLPDGSISVAAASAGALLQVLPRVLAVVRPGDDDVAAVLRQAGCEVLVCEDADRGMAASLTAALRASAGSAQGWIVALADMPFVAPDTIAALATALADGAQLAAPVFEGRRGNPAAFAAAMLPQLLALEGDQGARRLFEAQAWQAIAVDDAGVLRDIDVPADL